MTACCHQRECIAFLPQLDDDTFIQPQEPRALDGCLLGIKICREDQTPGPRPFKPAWLVNQIEGDDELGIGPDPFVSKNIVSTTDRLVVALNQRPLALSQRDQRAV